MSWPNLADLIVAVDGLPVARAGDLQRLMVGAALGKELAVSVLRGRRQVSVRVVLAELR